MDSFQLRGLSVLFRVLVAGFLAFGGVGVAYGQDSCTSSSPCERGVAYSSCMTATGGISRSGGYESAAAMCLLTFQGAPAGFYRPCLSLNGTSCARLANPNVDFYFYGCPSGSSWDAATNSCFSSSACLARNADLGANGGLPRPSLVTERCVAGCKFAMNTSGPDFSRTENQALSGGATATLFRGVMEYTGDPCSAGIDPEAIEEPKKPLKQECVPVGDQTVCRKPDGRECYTAGTTGNQICWAPGETGDKTDGPVLQKRQPGQPTPPNPVDLPNGDTATKSGDSITTNTTVINNGGNSTSITTTTTNYNTNSGANAGDKNDGEKADGTGEKPSEGNDETGAPSYDCSSPPACSSTDSIGCAMLKQTWSNHCKVFADYAGADPTDLSGEMGVDADGDLFSDEPGPDDVFGTLPSGGWAGRGSCPIDFSFVVSGKTFNLSQSQLCSLLDALAALVLVAAGVTAGRILGGGYR